MRQITKQAVNKFNNNENFTKDNTQVWFGRDVQLHQLQNYFYIII